MGISGLVQDGQRGHGTGCGVIEEALLGDLAVRLVDASCQYDFLWG